MEKSQKEVEDNKTDKEMIEEIRKEIKEMETEEEGESEDEFEDDPQKKKEEDLELAFLKILMELEEENTNVEKRMELEERNEDEKQMEEEEVNEDEKIEESDIPEVYKYFIAQNHGKVDEKILEQLSRNIASIIKQEEKAKK